MSLAVQILEKPDSVVVQALRALPRENPKEVIPAHVQQQTWANVAQETPLEARKNASDNEPFPTSISESRQDIAKPNGCELAPLSPCFPLT